jgi:hypothetical protein
VAFSARRSLRLCLSLAAVWSGLGTAACACYFAASTRPDQPSPFLLLGAIIGAFMLPACLVLPAVLLPAGGRYLRKAAPAAALAADLSSGDRTSARDRWMTGWMAAAQGSVLVEAYFILRLYWHLHAGGAPGGPSWHALGFSIAFLVTGAEMIRILIAAARGFDAARPGGGSCRDYPSGRFRRIEQ